RVVECRFGVRHAHNRGAAAERRCARTALDRLAVFPAWLAQMHLDVDEARCDDAAFGVEHGRARAGRDRPTYLRDIAVDNPHMSRARTSAVDDLATAQEDFRHLNCSLAGAIPGSARPHNGSS